VTVPMARVIVEAAKAAERVAEVAAMERQSIVPRARL
jgi:hypothetical protein